MSQLPTPEPAYVPYSDSVEEIQPDEAEHASGVVESMARVNRIMFERYRHGIRDAHAKSHGILRGELEVYGGLPSHLAQGLFARVERYPVIIRFSTAQGSIESDGKSVLRGMALKVVGAEQDFLLVNHPVIPTGTVKQYFDLQKKLEAAANSPHLLQPLVDAALVATRAVTGLFGTGSHILGDRYFSMAAIRYGDHVAKLCIGPHSANVAALQGTDMDPELIKAEPEQYLGTIVRRFFEHQAAEYELSAQLCTDLAAMPVEDASVEWSEAVSPYQPVARLTIPPQDPGTPARRVFGDDVLSFNPFRCLPEHRPLGSIMRVRRLAYESSSRFRHEMNAQPRREPRSIDELPG